MYSINVIQDDDAKFIGDFQVTFTDVDHGERSRQAIAWQLREIARRLDEGWQPRLPS